MINRLAGMLEAIEGLEATVKPDGMGMWYQVLVPAYEAQRLRERLGKPISEKQRGFFLSRS